MRIWLLGVLVGVSAGCASPSREELGQVWCEHVGWWEPPHALEAPDPRPLDRDLVGSADPKEAARIEAYVEALEAGRERNAGLIPHVAGDLPRCQSDYYLERESPVWEPAAWEQAQAAIEEAFRAVLACYEEPLLLDLERNHPAIWPRLADLIRLGRRQAPEVAWRTLGDSARRGKRLQVAFGKAEQLSEDLTQLLYRFDSEKLRRGDAESFLSDSGFKELVGATRRIWRLAGRDPKKIVRALKAWRRRALIRSAERSESLADLSRGAERYRDRALDAALDATLAAEGTRED